MLVYSPQQFDNNIYNFKRKFSIMDLKYKSWNYEFFDGCVIIFPVVNKIQNTVIQLSYFKKTPSCQLILYVVFPLSILFPIIFCLTNITHNGNNTSKKILSQ